MRRTIRLLAPLCASMVVCSPALATTTPDDPIPGDVNLDGFVDVADLNIVLAGQGVSGRVTRAMGDTNWDYSIDINDLNAVLATMGWLQLPLPSAPGVTLVDSLGVAPTDGAVTTLGDIYQNVSGTQVRVFRDMTLADTTTWTPAGVTTIAPTIDADWHTDGVDLTLTYSNPSSATTPVHMGSIQIPIFDRTGDKSYRDMKAGGALFDPGYNSSGNWSGPMLGYPGSLFAPAMVVEREDTSGGTVPRYAVGVSAQYPILEYEQSVHFHLSDFGGNDGMRLRFLPNPDNPNAANDYNPDADLQPGETREFVVSIRLWPLDAVSGHPGDWMHTLRTYRRWFRGNYGPVQYTRRVEQVGGGGIAQNGQISGTNPYGFTHQSTRRPDEFGFGPWRSVWDARAASGWERMMLWQPTGLYQSNTQNNFPPQFTSQWGPILSTVLPGYDDTLTPISTYGAGTGGTMGLWWGRSSQIADFWDDPMLEVFDHTNGAHLKFRANQMKGAIDVNAVEIGLDAFSKAGMWESYWTLVADRAEYPGIKFITEPMHGDFVQTLAPNFAKMTRNPGSTAGQLYNFPQGIPIVDFLVPGHETWGMIEARWIRVKLGYSSGAPVNPIEWAPFIQETADFGMVPTFFGEAPTEATQTEFDAAATWLNTVPPSLQ